MGKKKLSKEELKVLNQIYPLFKVEIEDTWRYRDVDSEIWIDSTPDELIRKGSKAVLYVKNSPLDSEWSVLYPSLPSDLVYAKVKIDHIKENYRYWSSNFLDPDLVMFTYQNQVFKNPYVMFDQLCVSGDPVEPEKYYCDGERVKVDFSEDYVFTFRKNELLVFNGQMFLNGELVATVKDIQESGIPYHRFEMMFGNDACSWVKNRFPEATQFNSWTASGPIV